MIVVNDGIGDGLRAAAALWRYAEDTTDASMVGAPTRNLRADIEVEQSPGDGAAQVFEALSFVNSVQRVPKGSYLKTSLAHRRNLADPEAWIGGWREGAPWVQFRAVMRDLLLPQEAFIDGGEWLDSAWMESGEASGFAGAPYIVVQPSTGFFKERQLSLTLPSGSGAVYVLLGSEADRSAETRLSCTPDGDDPFYLDLRGKTSIREALSWIWCAQAVVGCESWVAIAGALFGKPVVQEIDVRAWNDLAPTWQVLFSTMGFRLGGGW